MADLRECLCPLCRGGVPGGSSLVPRATLFGHQRLWRGLRPRGGKARPTAQALNQAQGGPAGAGSPAETGAEENGSPSPAPQPSTLRPNGICIPPQVFQDCIDDFVAYNFIVQHCLSRETAEDYLRQRRSFGKCRTAHLLNSMVESSVDLHTKEVDCCRNGCVAFTAHRETLTECDVCKTPRYRADGRPAKKATYWPLLPWLRMMLADPDIGVGMVSAMKEACQAAADGPPKDLRDWFDGATFRKLYAQGYFSTNTCIALSISTDGFQAWRQRGFEGWPIIATILNVDPSSRVQIVSQLILGNTPGPGQPADLESFLHPIAEELNSLAAGVSGVTVAGFPEPQVVHAFVVQFTTDMPGGDKLLNAVGCNGEYAGRFRTFAGVKLKRRYCYAPYAPDDPPPSKRPRFDVQGDTTPRRTAESITAGVAKVESARAAGQSKAAVRSLAQKEGFKVYSLFFWPSPADKARYPSLSYLWGLGPDLVPYDTMHLFLCNVVPRLWQLFAGENEKLGEDQPCLIPKAVCEAIGREIRAGRPTVPLSQARSLRNIYKHSGSYKAVDWMYFLLSVGEVVLADRIPEEVFKMFMFLCRAGRLLFNPSSLMEDELKAVDKLLKRFCHAFYEYVYAGKVERLRLCRPTIVALLDVPANLRSCGPAWSFWQFPAERLIGTLTRLIRSRRFPYAALTTAVSAKYSAELVTSFAEANVSDAWVEATGKPPRRESQDPVGTFSLSNVNLLPPRQAAAALIGQVLARMKAVLALKGVAEVPPRISAKKYFRVRLAKGQIAGTVSSSEETADRRRDYLVRVSSHVLQTAGRGRGQQRVPVNVYGTVHHYAVIFVDGVLKAFAYIECVRSTADRPGAYGLPEKRRDTECFSSLGGTMRYVDVTSVDAVVGTLYVRERHVVLYTREAFSSE